MTARVNIIDNQSFLPDIHLQMHLCRRVGFRALSSSGIRLQSTSTDSSFLISVPEIKRGKRVDVNAKRVPRLSKRKARKLLDATKKIAERTEANSADIKKKLAKPQKKETCASMHIPLL